MTAEGDNAFRDEYYSAWMDEPKIACESGNEADFENGQSSDAICDDADDIDMPDDDYFYDALVSDDNDLPPANIQKNQQKFAPNISLTGNSWKSGDFYFLNALDNQMVPLLTLYWFNYNVDSCCECDVQK